MSNRLQTICELKTIESKFQIENHAFLIGSCFAEEVGAMMKSDRLNVHVNPFGILFNPKSICTNLERILLGSGINDNSLIFHDDVWMSWNHHGKFYASEKEELISQLEQTDVAAKKALEASEWIIITLGTAWCYELKTTHQIVANCHKYPSNAFEKKMLSTDEIIQSLGKIIHLLKGKKVILTVSPVKYLREGLVNNNLSKAALLLAVNSICKTFKDVFYFPAYEIVIDELRDYRFFNEDMIHPNEQAIAYVYNRFREWIFDNRTNHIINNEIRPVIQAMNHRLLHPDTASSKTFKEQTQHRLLKLKENYPFLDFDI